MILLDKIRNSCLQFAYLVYVILYMGRRFILTFFIPMVLIADSTDIRFFSVTLPIIFFWYFPFYWTWTLVFMPMDNKKKAAFWLLLSSSIVGIWWNYDYLYTNMGWFKSLVDWIRATVDHQFSKT